MGTSRHGKAYENVVRSGQALAHIGDVDLQSHNFVGNAISGRDITIDHRQQHGDTYISSGITIKGDNYGIIHATDRSSSHSLKVKIFNWLQPPEHNAPDTFSRTQGTNEWFLQDEAFETWTTSPASALHVHGPRGCGKTVLSFSILEHLQTLSAALKTVLFFFFSASDSGRRNCKSMLKGLLWQLCELEEVPKSILNLYRTNEHKIGSASLSNEELIKTFRQVVTELKGDCYLVFDGLDEVEYGAKRAEVVQFLLDLLALRQKDLHILVASRSEPDIIAYFEEAGGWDSVAVDTEQIAKDIKAYVDNQLLSYPDLKRLSVRTKAMIRERLCPPDNAMFQWTVLHLNRLKFIRRTNDKKVQALLNDLPETLNDTYSKVLQEIPDDERACALLVLKCLLLAIRPLWAEELLEFLKTANLYPGSVQGLEYTESMNLMDIFCMMPSMLILDPWPRSGILDNLDLKRHKVLLGHFSIEEFLTSPLMKSSDVAAFGIEPESSHRQLSALCIQHLVANNDETRKTQLTYLMEYAWAFWSVHAVAVRIRPKSEEIAEAQNIFRQVSHAARTEKLPKEMTNLLGNVPAERLREALSVPYFDAALLTRYRYQDCPDILYYQPGTILNCDELQTLQFEWDEDPSVFNANSRLLLCRVLTEPSNDLRFVTVRETAREIRHFTTIAVYTYVDESIVKKQLPEFEDVNIVRINSTSVRVSSTLFQYLQDLVGLHTPVCLWVDEICVPLSIARLKRASSTSHQFTQPEQKSSEHEIGKGDCILVLPAHWHVTLLLGEIHFDAEAYLAAVRRILKRAVFDSDRPAAKFVKSGKMLSLSEVVDCTRVILGRLTYFPPTLARERVLTLNMCGHSEMHTGSLEGVCRKLTLWNETWLKNLQPHPLVERFASRDISPTGDRLRNLRDFQSISVSDAWFSESE